jgi:hypothetical protein
MDNEDYSPGDQFDADDGWISALQYTILVYTLIIELQEGSANILPTCGGAKPRRRKRQQRTDTTHSRSEIFCHTWKSASLSSVGLGRWVERTKENEKGHEQSFGRIRSATERLAVRCKHLLIGQIPAHLIHRRVTAMNLMKFRFRDLLGPSRQGR